MLILRAVQYLVLIALWFASAAFPPRRQLPGGERRGGFAPAWRVAACVALLVAAAGAQFFVVDAAARQQVPLPAWRAALPLVPIDDGAPLFGHTAQWIGESSGALSVLQALALGALYALLRGRALSRASWIAVWLGAAALACLALLSTGITSSDVYLYAGHGRLGLAAYAPPAVRFPGEFGAINDLRGVPVYPSLYGPVWLAAAAAVSSLVGGLAAQLFAFRILGLACFALCVGLIATLQRAPATLALFALNPAFYGEYVANAHNDVLPLALTLAALRLAPRRSWLALLFAIVAGATKLPFALAALVAFDAVENRTRRIAFGAAAAAGALAATYAASGGQYFATAARMSARITRDPLILVTHDFAIGLAALAALLALLFRRYLAGASWSFVSLSTTLFPWYVAWSVPYALVEETLFPLFLCSLPIVTFLLSSVYAPTPLSEVLFMLAIAAPIFLVLRGRRGTAA